MREVKYRAYHKQLKKIFPVTKLEWKHGVFYVSMDGGEHNGDLLSKYDEVVLMQYTGFEDRNRKNIYEGDILSVKNFESGIESKVTCQYSYGAFKFNGWLFYDLPDRGYFVEVVGNIYENHELLEVA